MLHSAAGLVGGIDLSTPVSPTDAVVLPVPGVITVVLQDRQHGLVTGAQVILGAGHAIVAVVPAVIADAPDAAVFRQELGEVILHPRHVGVVTG